MRLIRDELNDLFLEPILHEGRLYYVMLYAVTGDGEGWKKLAKQQGSNSVAGCIKCDGFTGIKVGNAIKYIGHRRFLPKNDERRKRKIFYFDEEEDPTKPQYHDEEKRGVVYDMKYDKYIELSKVAENTGVPQQGCKGVWAFHGLKYSHLICKVVDGMHCFANVIELIINIVKPNGGAYGENRTCKNSTREYEGSIGRFRHISRRFSHYERTTEESQNATARKSKATEKGIPMYFNNATTPRWVFSTREAEISDSRLRGIVLESAEAKIEGGLLHTSQMNSYDKLIYGTRFARYCWTGLGDSTVTSLLLDIFDLISSLCADSFSLDDALQLRKRTINLLSNFEGFLPHSEMTITMHQLYHICNDIINYGPPRCLWMFSFERMNKYLSDLIKNPAKPFASIAKNYALTEMSVNVFSYSLENLQQ